MTRTRLRIARAATLAAVGGGAAYLFWRTGQVAELGVPSAVLLVAEVANYLALVVAAVLFWTPHARAPRAAPAPAAATVDVFIPVCGEDVDMVEATVLAALAIEWPHETIVLNDGRIAGVESWREIDELCARLGVRCLTRRRGSRGKAGNLNAALPQTRGEFIVTLDADHLARPELAAMLLGHLEDERVAFVASRQAFQLDRGDALGHLEALFYRTIQPAKDRDNAAFSCGSGVAYRRSAIEDIGGFSEWNIVEDLHTSYELHARGWRSAYVRTPVSVGTAPSTAAEMANQRLRWATDSLRMFFFDNPLRKRGLTARQRLHYLHTTGWYLVAATHVIFLFSPVVSVLGGVQLFVHGTETTYALLLGAYLAPLAALLCAHVGWRAALRTAQQQTFLAPVYAVAIVRALRSAPGRRRAARRRMRGEITRKTGERRMNPITAFQLVMIGLLLVAIGVAIGRPDAASWPVVVWASVLAFALATPGSMLGLARESTQSLRIAIAAPAACAALLVMSVSATTSITTANTSAPAPAAAAAAKRALAPPAHGIYLGVYHRSVAGPPDAPLDTSRYRGARLRIVHRFHAWWGSDRFLSPHWLSAVHARGAVPMITWEPLRRAGESIAGVRQPRRLVRRIARGAYDAYIRRWAHDAAAYGKPIVIRLMHEMNGDWYPWSPAVNGNSARAFKTAWRRVHGMFTAAGATNVSWEFSVSTFAGGRPTSRRELDAYYPGSRYVDWIGLSGFNWSLKRFGGTMAFGEVFAPAYDIVRGFGKPISIAETGTPGAQKARSAAWVRDAMRTAVRRFPRVKTLVWYDAPHPERDFTMREEALAAWRAGARQRALRPPLKLRATR